MENVQHVMMHLGIVLTEMIQHFYGRKEIEVRVKIMNCPGSVEFLL